ncbi:MAG: Lrp/AsnC family transcriptional regulator [Methanomassiliicoccales archaeon]|nr:MAG: Lrp/AsnC family transcriptional regulator [Methanomassiliicoccales archaeon]
MKSIDELDQDILRMLLKDASVNYETIAKEVDTSVGTVHNRIKRMKEEKIIIRIIPELDAEKLGFGICAMIDVRIKGGHLEELQKRCSKYENVCSIYDITGDYDTTFITKFKNTEALNTFVKELAGQRYVLRTHTKLILNVIKEGFVPKI